MAAWRWIVTGVAFALAALWILEPEYAYLPAPSRVENPAPSEDAVVTLGRKAFYGQTFGNEVFFSDILGILDGPVNVPNLVRAILQLRGRGTSNLEVQLSRSVRIGSRTFPKGTRISTGLDVPAGAWLPLGIPLKFSGGRFKVGISCALCHTAVDPQSKRVVEGAPNSDLNVGLLLAMASNSAAYFPHAKLGAQDRTALLPDPQRLEEAVDEIFQRWPPGTFDTTPDLESNPVKIPDVFTRGDHPYGWSGFATAGPFQGLSAFTNNFTRDADPLTDAEVSPSLMGIDKETYIGTILRRAANPRFRFEPGRRWKPSEFFARVDPTPGRPGVMEVVVPPSYPSATLLAPTGLMVGSPGYRPGEQADAISAWENTLSPPVRAPGPAAGGAVRGKAVFQQAGCAACHVGSSLTNHQVVPSEVIGTEPSRARALKRAGRQLEVTEALDAGQIKLAWARGESAGGYKVPSLIGLRWTAPYLHDGGVAVGASPGAQTGVTDTVLKGIRPDPAQSLLALVDRQVRQRVVQANRSSNDLRSLHIEGIGHSYWVDPTAGFSRMEQESLIDYLLSLPP